MSETNKNINKPFDDFQPEIPSELHWENVRQNVLPKKEARKLVPVFILFVSIATSLSLLDGALNQLSVSGSGEVHKKSPSTILKAERRTDIHNPSLTENVEQTHQNPSVPLISNYSKDNMAAELLRSKQAKVEGIAETGNVTADLSPLNPEVVQSKSLLNIGREYRFASAKRVHQSYYTSVKSTLEDHQKFAIGLHQGYFTNHGNYVSTMDTWSYREQFILSGIEAKYSFKQGKNYKLSQGLTLLFGYNSFDFNRNRVFQTYETGVVIERRIFQGIEQEIKRDTLVTTWESRSTFHNNYSFFLQLPFTYSQLVWTGAKQNLVSLNLNLNPGITVLQSGKYADSNGNLLLRRSNKQLNILSLNIGTSLTYKFNAMGRTAYLDLGISKAVTNWNRTASNRSYPFVVHSSFGMYVGKRDLTQSPYSFKR